MTTIVEPMLLAPTSRPAHLTPKGMATRARIVEAAANLIYLNGVHRTSNDDVRRAALVSGSQLTHYFPDKQSLVRAVVSWRADRVTDLQRIPGLVKLDSLAALRLWADSSIEHEGVCRGGCGFGSLASEILRTDMDVVEQLNAGFERWEDLFRDGLAAMKERGDLRPDADPDQLAYVLIAAFQGGMLLAQTARDVTPLRAALDGAIAVVSAFAVSPHPDDD